MLWIYCAHIAQQAAEMGVFGSLNGHSLDLDPFSIHIKILIFAVTFVQDYHAIRANHEVNEYDFYEDYYNRF